MADGVYVLPRDRDAYSTIRGFVYQVDLTIRRWMDLGDDQHLELERGEDIDLVNRAITATTVEETGRLLEQVKHREQNVTLRNPAALEALANAVEHLSTNTGLDLRFCYTTNAWVGTERPCPFPNGTAGISLWERVRQGQLTGSALADATKALALFLSQAACPDGLDASVWTRFKQVVNAADLTDFTALVARFEWSTSATGATALTPEIMGLLTQRSLAADTLEAEQLYQRLFLFIFKRLCQPGVKRLTRAELREQLAAATLSASDHAMLSRLTQCFSIVKLKVDELEAALTSVSDDVRELARTQGVHATLLRGTLTIDLAPPPVLARCSQRDGVVGQLVGHLGRSVWTALTGASDTGKSQLAVLLIARVGNLAGWVRFGHDMEPAAASATLDGAVGSMCGEGRPESASGWYQGACKKLGCGKIIVLDDLPRMNGTDPLTQRLLLLASACKVAGVRIVSTSHHQLPAKLVSGLGQTEFSFLPVPMLTETEVRETLAAYEAPEPILTSGAPRLIYVSSGGHPLLVSLAADYLRDRDWRFTTEEVEGLLAGEHAESITDEVLSRIMDSLADQQRELLYRLTLPVGAFVLDVVTALAQVTPAVDRPREQLNKLLGAWVQRDAERHFIVSPLVKGVSSEALPVDTQKGCHLSLAELIVGETMSIYEAQQAINHFCAAEAFDRAGSLFLYLLDEARTLEAGKDIGLLDRMWAESPLPDGMDFNVRLLARGLQLVVLPKYNRSIDFVLSDLDRLMAAATEAHSHAITGVAVLASVYLASSDPDRTLRYIGRALLMSDAVQDGGEVTFLAEGRRLDDVLWFVVPHLVTAGRLDRWLTILEGLPPDRRQRLLSGEDSFLGCIVVADRLRMDEAGKPVPLRQWGGVLAAAENLRQRARAMGSGTLEGAAIRTLLSIHGEHLRQLDNGVATATEALGRLDKEPDAIFMIAGMLGRQYAFAGGHAEARPFLEMSLVQPAGERTHERMITLLAASECFGVADADQGIRYAEQAVHLARSEERIPVIEAGRAGAELTTALYLRTPTQEGAIAAFATWSEAAERVIESRDESDEWKDLFVIFAHQTSYLTSMALKGRPPSGTATGEEFAAPIRGVFVRTSPGRIAYYRQSSVPAVMWMLSQYAAAVGNDQAAAMWLARVSSLTDPTRLRLVEAMIGHDMIPGLIAAGKYSEAIDAALRYCHANHLFTRSQVRNQDEMERGVDLAASWNGLQTAEREMVERRAALLAVVPAMFWVGNLMLESPTQGIAQGRTLASACRQIANTATDSTLWNALADTLDRVFQDQASGHALVASGNAFWTGSRQVVAIIAYLGASLHGAPDDAFNAQLAVMQTLFLAFPPSSATYRQLFLVFVECFWTATFDQRRFGFSNPALVEEALAQARQVPVERRVKAILRAIRLGVTSRADAGTTAWLDTDG
jgi:hypothetical protein